MKIEKLNKNKIRITFNYIDLQKNNIDIHSFMSNSIESQSLFLNILDEAEREIGFITDNYKLSIEAIALNDGTFIITVTRIEKNSKKALKVHTQRKTLPLSTSNNFIYKFSNYDDLICFEKFLENSDSELFSKFSNSYLLYEYNNCFFLIINNLDNKNIMKLTNIIIEFAIQIENSEFLIEKIREFGKNCGDGDGLGK